MPISAFDSEFKSLLEQPEFSKVFEVSMTVKTASEHEPRVRERLQVAKITFDDLDGRVLCIQSIKKLEVSDRPDRKSVQEKNEYALNFTLVPQSITREVQQASAESVHEIARKILLNLKDQDTGYTTAGDKMELGLDMLATLLPLFKSEEVKATGVKILEKMGVFSVVYATNEHFAFYLTPLQKDKERKIDDQWLAVLLTRLIEGVLEEHPPSAEMIFSLLCNQVPDETESREQFFHKIEEAPDQIQNIAEIRALLQDPDKFIEVLKSKNCSETQIQLFFPDYKEVA